MIKECYVELFFFVLFLFCVGVVFFEGFFELVLGVFIGGCGYF